ncbi:hypothetical protein Btru_056477 [Bulinus truncatus]|nr:hypothetical protein Btru_056477 [Bulinus truncatus]
MKDQWQDQHNLDEMLTRLNPRGVYQMLQMSLMFLVMFPAAYQLLGNIFINKHVPHSCARGNESDLPHTHETNVSYGQCHVTIWSNQTLLMKSPCPSGVKYPMRITTSTVSQFNLVCDRINLARLSQTLVIAGQAVGAILGTMLSDKFGRKLILVASNVGLLVSGLAIAFAPTYTTFAAFKFIAGGFQQKDLVTCDEPPETLVTCDEPPETLVACDEPPETLVTCDEPPETLVTCDEPPETLVTCDEPPETLVTGDEPPDTLVICDEPPETLVTCDEPPETLVNCEEPPETLVTCDEPPETLVTCDESPDTLVNCEEPPDTLVTCDEPPKELVTHEEPPETLVNRYEPPGEQRRKGTITTSATLCLELFPSNDRRITAVVFGLIWSAAAMTLALFAFLLHEYSWRVLQAALSCSSCLVLLQIWFLDESPRWLMANSKNNKAFKILQKAAKLNGKDPSIISQMITCTISGHWSLPCCPWLAPVEVLGVVYLYTPEMFPTNLRNQALGLSSSFARLGGMIAPFMGLLAELAIWGPGLLMAVLSGLPHCDVICPSVSCKRSVCGYVELTSIRPGAFTSFRDVALDRSPFCNEGHKDHEDHLNFLFPSCVHILPVQFNAT